MKMEKQMRAIVNWAILPVVMALAATSCSSPDQVAILSATHPADGGLRIVFDHPCPEGGPFAVDVVETDTEVVVTATVTDGQVLDCGGGFPVRSDVSETEVGLKSPLRDRTVIDGSSGEPVTVEDE